MTFKKVALCTVLVLLTFMMLVGCAEPDEPAASATPDVSATVSAAIAATAEFDAQLEAVVATEVASSVDTAVDETVAETFDVYSAQTEEALAQMIETAVEEAVLATESYATTTVTATADDQVTATEVQTIEVTVQTAETAVAEAEALIETYYALYGDLAQQTLDELAVIEDELAAIATGINEMNETLIAINDTLNAGLTLAEDTITQLENSAASASASAQAAYAEAQTWVQAVQGEAQARLTAVQQMQPTNIASNQAELMAQATTYLETVGSVTADSVVSQAELQQVAQLSANVSASMQAVGGPQSQELASGFNQLTQQLAAGNMTQAQLNISNLQAQLSTQFAGIELPAVGGGALDGFSPPSRPQRP